MWYNIFIYYCRYHVVYKEGIKYSSLVIFCLVKFCCRIVLNIFPLYFIISVLLPSSTALPEVRVVPKLQSRAPGELAEMECRATGVPQPRVYWLKNDEELRMGSEKYAIIGLFFLLLLLSVVIKLKWKHFYLKVVINL